MKYVLKAFVLFLTLASALCGYAGSDPARACAALMAAAAFLTAALEWLFDAFDESDAEGGTGTEEAKGANP